MSRGQRSSITKGTPRQEPDVTHSVFEADASVGRLRVLWAISGVAVLFAWAVVRLGGRGLNAIGSGLGRREWIVLTVTTVVFVYGEGIVSLERSWVPRMVERARGLRDRTGGASLILAPLYGLGLLGGTSGSKVRAWSGTLAIVGAILLLRGLPDPWRGIIDLAVAGALAWGLVAIARQGASALG